MNDVHVSSGVLKDTASVSLKSLWYSDSTGNRSSLVDFLHHVFFSFNGSVLVNVMDRVLIWDEAWS